MLNQQAIRSMVTALFVGSMVGMSAGYARAGDGQAGHDHGQAGHDHAKHDRGADQGQPNDAMAHHGGQVSKTENYSFEIVYQTRETRIYLYGHDHENLDMQRITGRTLMQVRGSDKALPFPIQYVAAKPNSDRDFLVVPVDVSNMRDGDMRVTFELANLPLTQETEARFTQTFALSRPLDSSALVSPPLDQQQSCGHCKSAQ